MPTEVEGSGSIAGPHGGQANFSMDVKIQKVKKKTQVVGTFSYNDPTEGGPSFSSNTISSLTFNGRHAHFVGTKALTKKSKITFTVDVTDNGTPGTLDTFSIQLNTGYSASGNLTSGNLTIH